MNKEKKASKQNKKTKFNKQFLKKNILGLICIALSIAFILIMSSINIFPRKYIVIASLILMFINMIGIFIINVGKKKIFKILGFTVLALSIIISFFGAYYLSKTNKFIDKSFISSSIYQKNTYYVLSLASKNRKSEDITSEVSVYKETINLEKAINKLNKKYPIQKKEYEDIDTMFENLNNETDKFLLIEKSAYEIILSISETIKKENYNITYKFDILTKNKINNNQNTEKFNVYIGGTDFAGLMDFNMIATVNTETHKVLLTSIPRDYYIEVAGKDGKKDKLSFMIVHGKDTNKNSLANLFETPIDYSVTINTDSLVDVVDYVGGIEFCSDYSFTTTHALVRDTYIDYGKKLTIRKGCQHLNGIETLTVARERNAFPGRDRIRQENCQKIILAIFKKLITADTILHYNRTLNTLSPLYETDIPKDIITSITKDALNNRNVWQVDVQSVNGKDTKDKVYLSNLIDWVMYPDYETVNTAKERIKNTLE